MNENAFGELGELSCGPIADKSGQRLGLGVHTGAWTMKTGIGGIRECHINCFRFRKIGHYPGESQSNLARFSIELRKQIPFRLLPSLLAGFEIVPPQGTDKAGECLRQVQVKCD